jgi:peptide/nickel transport system permease protein
VKDGNTYRVALWTLIFLLACALFSLLYTPYNPFAMNAAELFRAPSFRHPFGTDNFGRDILSRTMVALRYSLLFSTCTLALSFSAGVTLGLLSAYSHKALDALIMRCVDAVSSIPLMLLALALLAIFKRETPIPAMAILFVPSFVRITRNETLKIKELPYIDHARVLGAGKLRIMYAHILPSLAPSLFSTAIVVLVNSITVESALSYLGIGIQPPTPSLGRMLFDAQSYLFYAPWAAALPCIVMVLLLSAFNYLGEGLRRSTFSAE